MSCIGNGLPDGPNSGNRHQKIGKSHCKPPTRAERPSSKGFPWKALAACLVLTSTRSVISRLRLKSAKKRRTPLLYVSAPRRSRQPTQQSFTAQSIFQLSATVFQPFQWNRKNPSTRYRQRSSPQFSKKCTLTRIVPPKFDMGQKHWVVWNYTTSVPSTASNRSNIFGMQSSRTPQLESYSGSASNICNSRRAQDKVFWKTQQWNCHILLRAGFFPSERFSLNIT